MAGARLTVPIRGMHCAACVQTIEETCAELPGVEQAQVNFATEEAALQVELERFDAAGLDSALLRRGYRLVPDRHLYEITGLDDSTSERRLENELTQIPGVLAAEASFGISTLRVDSLPGMIQAKAIQETISSQANQILQLRPRQIDFRARRLEHQRLGIRILLVLADDELVVRFCVVHSLLAQFTVSRFTVSRLTVARFILVLYGIAERLSRPQYGNSPGTRQVFDQRIVSAAEGAQIHELTIDDK